MKLLVRWVLSAIALMIVANFVRGIEVRGFGTALVAAVIIGLLNATLGLFLKVVTFPLTILTFGLFLVVINAMMLKLASNVVSGLYVANWTAAFIGALLLSVVSTLLGWAVKDAR